MNGKTLKSRKDLSNCVVHTRCRNANAYSINEPKFGR